MFFDILGSCVEEGQADTESLEYLLQLLKALLQDKSAMCRARIIAVVAGSVKFCTSDSACQQLAAEILTSGLMDRSKVVRLKALSAAHDLLHQGQIPELSAIVISVANQLLQLITLPPSSGFSCKDTVDAAGLAFCSENLKQHPAKLQLDVLFTVPANGNARKVASQILTFFLDDFTAWINLLRDRSFEDIEGILNFVVEEADDSGLVQNLSSAVTMAFTVLAGQMTDLKEHACKILYVSLRGRNRDSISGANDADEVLLSHLAAAVQSHAAAEPAARGANHDKVKWAFKVWMWLFACVSNVLMP